MESSSADAGLCRLRWLQLSDTTYALVEEEALWPQFIHLDVCLHSGDARNGWQPPPSGSLCVMPEPSKQLGPTEWDADLALLPTELVKVILLQLCCPTFQVAALVCKKWREAVKGAAYDLCCVLAERFKYIDDYTDDDFEDSMFAADTALVHAQAAAMRESEEDVRERFNTREYRQRCALLKLDREGRLPNRFYDPRFITDIGTNGGLWLVEAASGSVDEALALLTLGALDRDEEDPEWTFGWTSLHVAVAGGHAALVQKLLAIGPPFLAETRVNARGPAGRTPLHLACGARGMPESWDPIGSHAGIYYLDPGNDSSYEPDADGTDMEGVVRLLLANRADPTLLDEDDRTALSYASRPSTHPPTDRSRSGSLVRISNMLRDAMRAVRERESSESSGEDS